MRLTTLLTIKTVQKDFGMPFLLLLLVCVSSTITGQPQNSISSAECSRDKPPFSFVRGQDSTMWDIVWVSPQGHRSVSVSRHFLLQAPQCPCSVRKRFSRDHCCRGRSKPSCRIVGSHTRWELTTWADFQLCLHRLLMSTSCKYSHNGFLDVSPNVHQQNFTEKKNIPWNISCGCILHSSVSETCSWSMALSLSPTTDSWPSSRAPPPYQTLHAVHNSKYFNTWSPVTTILVRCPLQGAATW